MSKSLSLLLFATLVLPAAYAQTLCRSHENVVFSFRAQDLRKTVSLCKGSQSEYLVYRFGTKANVELQYPANLDETSWKKFDFSGRRRGGGKANAGFGDYSLSFVTGQAEYVIFQEWDDEDETYSIGINVQTNKKSISLQGDRNTQQGSLVLLEGERNRLRNLLED